MLAEVIVFCICMAARWEDQANPCKLHLDSNSKCSDLGLDEEGSADQAKVCNFGLDFM